MLNHPPVTDRFLPDIRSKRSATGMYLSRRSDLEDHLPFYSIVLTEFFD